MWWRLESNSDKSLRTITEVEEGRKNGRNIVYIEAGTKEEALALYVKRYDEMVKRATDATRALQQKRKRAGVCVRCGAERGEDGSKTKCRPCLNVKKAEKLRAANDEPKLNDRNTTEAMRAAAHARWRDLITANTVKRQVVHARALVYSSCLERYDTDPSAYRQWLVEQAAAQVLAAEEIEASRSRAAAAE